MWRRCSTPPSTQHLVERSLAASTFGSMWLDIPRPDYPPLTAPVTCDLLVVGGGYTGLWTALHAAERNPGRRIVLIEANRIGWAASGRNGGFVDASLTHGAENGKSRWPNEIDTLDAMGLENLDGMQADIERLGLNTEWQRTGMLSVATEPHQVDWLRAGRGRRRRPLSRHAAGARGGELADLSRGPVQPRHLRHRPSRQAGAANWPAPARTPACRSTSTPTPPRLDAGGAALRVDTATATITAQPGGAGDERLSRACCGATGCAPCRCTTTCWPPSR